MKKIYYWSPCLSKVGTYKSTLNSAISFARYSKENFSVKLINACGEWDEEKSMLKDNNVEIINFNIKYFKYLPKTGFFKSRLSYLIIFIFSIIPLIKLLTKDKPEYLVAHLITSLPLILQNLFNFQSKLILRISGFPKLNFFRRSLWYSVSKKVDKITCPTNELKKQLVYNKVFSEDKIFFLADPIPNIKDFQKKRKISKTSQILKHKKNYFLAAGRLTKQKNFSYLINEYSQFSKKNKDIDLLIFGKGEEIKYLKDLIKKNDLTERVFLMGYTDHIFYYMKHAEAFILSSLWEDPGFVIIEAAFNNLFVISSNCKNGPSEFLQNGNAGNLFKSNEKGALENSLNNFILEKKNNLNKRILAKKNCLKYTLYRHNNSFKKILKN